MNETTAPLLYRSVPGGRAEGREAIVCALRFSGDSGLSLEGARISWSSRAIALLRELLSEGRSSTQDKGQTLPYASLRAALGIALPEALVIDRQIGAPWDENPRAFLDTDGWTAEMSKRFTDAFALWLSLSLRPWAADIGASEIIVDAIEALGENAISIVRRQGDLADILGSETLFPEKRDAILQRISRALEGTDLFAGLGPVRRIVRAHGASNVVEFLTWPVAADDGLQSMVARLAVETLPFSSDPIITVRASRRRWLTNLPSGKSLFGQRSIQLCMMSAVGAPIALEVNATVRGQTVLDPIAPEFLAQLLQTQADLGTTLADMIARGIGTSNFTGVAYSPNLGGSHALGAGVSTRDQLDLFDAVGMLLDGDGFEPVAFDETPSLRRAPKRPPELHKALEAEALLSDIAIAIGRNDLDDDASIEAAWRSLGIEGDTPPLNAEAAHSAGAKLAELRQANGMRLARAFGDRAPHVVLLARTEEERKLLSTILEALFGSAIDVEQRPLPLDVHGARGTLPRSEAKAKDRFDARVSAWRPLAEQLHQIAGGCHVLVQAADWYEKKPDDKVNKLAGRYALAAEANANVQYLRPREKGHRGFAHYLHRVQAAIYDLVFGHSGLVSDVSVPLANAFPHESARPTSIIGISVLTQSRTRLGGKAGRLCFATRIDAATNRTSARVGWYSGEMRWTKEWEPLFDALKRIASPEIAATLGKGAAEQRSNFQQFVAGILDDCAEAGERPLVLVDSTSASGLWPWLSDGRIGQGLTIGAEGLDASRRWPDTRIVRIRLSHAARMVERKRALYQQVDAISGEDIGGETERYCPTIVARTVRLSAQSGMAHYWTTSGYFQMSIPRGLSVYRRLASFVPIAKIDRSLTLPPGHKRLFSPVEIDIAKDSYRLPNPIETTVALQCDGDDPDLIAHLVASLREGYGHTAAATALPAPLSFEAKARDYMTRFELDLADQDDGEVPVGDSETTPPEANDDEEISASEGDVQFNAIDPRAWRKLVDRKGISFMDSTSLSSSNLSTDSSQAAAFTPPPPSPLASSPRAATEVAEDVDFKQQPTATAPVLELPPFVDAEWLRSVIHVPNAQLRAMHEARSEIARRSGFNGWPQSKPDIGAFIEMLPEALRYPRFLDVASEAARRKLSPKKARHWVPYLPFWKMVASEAGAIRAVSDNSDPSLSSQLDVTTLLAEGGKTDLAAHYIFLFSYIYETPEELFAFVETDPRFEDLLPFIRGARRELFRSDFRAAIPPFDGTQPSEFADSDATESVGVALEDIEMSEGDGALPSQNDTEVSDDESALFTDADHGAAAGDPQAEWNAALDRIIGAATYAGNPQAETIEAIGAELEQLQAAFAAFAAARPKLVDASELAVRAVECLRSADAILIEAGQPEEGASPRHISGTPMLEPELVEELEGELGKHEAAVGKASQLLGEARDIMQGGLVARLEDIVTLRSEAVAAARDALRQLRALLQRIEEGPQDVAESGLAVMTASEPSIIARDDPTGHPAAGPNTAPTADEFESSDLMEDQLVGEEWGNSEDENGEQDEKSEAGDSTEGSVTASQAASAEITANEATEEAASSVKPASVPDPILARIEDRFLGLVAKHQFGLAYHLGLAAENAGFADALPLSRSELRLAAMAGHVNHAAIQGSELLHSHLVEANAKLDAIDDGEPLAAARKILAIGYLAPFALYHADAEARKALDALRHVADGLGEGVHALRAALATPVNLGLNLSPSLMRLANEEAEEDRYVQDITRNLLTELEDFANKTYKFQLGIKLRNVLSRGDGEMAQLRDRIEKGGNIAIKAAREFSASYSDRGAIFALLKDAETRTGNYKFTGIDGIARERMIGAIQSIAAICAEYVEVTGAAPAFRGTKQSVQRVQTAITAAITALQQDLRAFVSDDALTQAAISYTLSALDRVLASVNGSASNPGPADHLLAVHAPLLWFSEFDFGQSWLPAPYVPERIVGVILGRPEDEDVSPTPEEFALAVRDRIGKGAHIAATMLIDAAPFYRVAPDEADMLAEAREADVGLRRDALEVDVRDARLMVDRLQRMGEGASQDDAQSLLSLLGRIVPEDLPVIVPFDARTENIEDQQILDFRASYDLIRDIRARISTLLQRPREALLERLDRLAGTSSSEDIEKVKGLVSRDDLLTAGEYVDFLENGRALPETTSPNPRFQAFFPAVPEALSSLDRGERDSMVTSISQGRDIGPLKFSRIRDDRRAEAADAYEKWRELKRAVIASRPESEVVGKFAYLLAAFGLNGSVGKSSSRANRRVYACDFSFEIALDSETVLLPDFGSLTGGNYRVCVAAKLPTEAEFQGLQKEAGALRLVVFVTETVTVDQRRQLLLMCLERGMRILVVDEAILSFTLAEPTLRGATLFECAQPFSFAEPYHDYGNAAVPREMFFGRSIEKRKLLEPHGSCIVYGGRRLGKTALLRHIQTEAHDPEAGTAVAFVPIRDLGASAGEEQIWDYMSRDLKSVFPKPVENEEKFSTEVRRWLDADSKRRILVLLDESDRFIESDANGGFTQFIRLQRLMDDTNRRFKFVLAGLHNVTRIVHTENPPLKQIASDPQRIGPLMDAELGDAEALVVRPLAGMGYEFESREDVWRILSYCNYYPVLVQKFCKELIQQLGGETLKRRRPVTRITSDHIRQALENEAIAKEIGETFDYTISKIEDRYALIANIVADRATRDAANGRIGEGMSAVEVRDAAALWWPSAFREANRLAVVEDLLDEMEGLGVLRRTPSGRWALRSPTILRLLGDDDKITAKLGEFMDRGAPAVFDPRSMRRSLKANPLMKIGEGEISPLTFGQEHDLLRDRAPVTLLFGNQLSGIGLVSGALASIGPTSDGKRPVDVAPRAWPNLEAFRKEIRSAASDRPILHVVDPTTDWTSDWVVEANRIKAVRDGRARVLFVGEAEHALSWVLNPYTLQLNQDVRIATLQAWSNTLINHKLEQEHFDPDQCRERLREATGGFNRAMQEAFAGNVGTMKQFLAKTQTALTRRRVDSALPAELGLIGPMYDLFVQIARYAGANDVTAYEIQEGPVAEMGATLTGLRVVEFGLLMAILDGQTGAVSNTDDARPYRLNPLLLSALSAGKS